MTLFASQLRDYRLTTALITYRMPDHLSLLQEFLWQEIDLPPRYPELERFLAYWERHLDGPLHSVEIASVKLIQPARVGCVDHWSRLH
jgi:uncharacterized protein Usg